VFAELMGIVSAIVSGAMQPHWFAIALLILYPIAVWIGYVMARRAAQGSQSARAAVDRSEAARACALSGR